MKPKKCRQCRELFEPRNTLQIVCKIACANAYAIANREKAHKTETRAMKKARDDLDRSLWIKKAQAACNAYIRERDHALPCVSCGRYHNGQYHAGHYIPAGRGAALRFDERNIWKQCSACNSHLSGNLVGYRKSLISKIGAEMVEWLESNHDVKRWTIPELKQIEAGYKSKLRGLKDEA